MRRLLVLWAGLALAAPGFGADGGLSGDPISRVDDARQLIIMLFSNGAPQYDNGIEVTMNTVADDFELLTSDYPANMGTITLMDIGCEFPSSWEGVLRWWILVDTGSGEPGDTVATGWAPWVDWSAGPDYCATVDYRFFQVWFPFGQSVDLAAGTRYWLAFHMARDWGWYPGTKIYVSDAATPRLNPAMYQESPTDPWDGSWGYDVAFAIKHNPQYTYLFYDGFESADTTLWSEDLP